jgi:hypothetical protein
MPEVIMPNGQVPLGPGEDLSAQLPPVMDAISQKRRPPKEPRERKAGMSIGTKILLWTAGIATAIGLYMGASRMYNQPVHTPQPAAITQTYEQPQQQAPTYSQPSVTQPQTAGGAQQAPQQAEQQGQVSQTKPLSQIISKEGLETKLHSSIKLVVDNNDRTKITGGELVLRRGGTARVEGGSIDDANGTAEYTWDWNGMRGKARIVKDPQTNRLTQTPMTMEGVAGPSYEITTK